VHELLLVLRPATRAACRGDPAQTRSITAYRDEGADRD
jgi:hypothetical protein